MKTETNESSIEDLSSSQRSLGRNSSSLIRDITGDNGIDEEIQYISLRDIISYSSSPPRIPSYYNNNGDCNSFISMTSNITIKNNLVKRAASAYLQSAAILASSRDESCIVTTFNGRTRNKDVLCSCWRVNVSQPIKALFQPIIQCFASLLRNISRECFIFMP